MRMRRLNLVYSISTHPLRPSLPLHVYRKTRTTPDWLRKKKRTMFSHYVYVTASRLSSRFSMA